MPRRRNETAEEYYIRMKNEAYEAKQEYNKEQRRKRNELIKNAESCLLTSASLMT